MFQLSIVPVMLDVVVIIFPSIAVLTTNGNFGVVPQLHSVSDTITQCVAVSLQTTETCPFL